jgi:hypothetical protein
MSLSTIYNDQKETNQSIYDSFNNFILSEDRNIFFKMVKKIELFNRVKNIPGDIVECGVFKGTGMMVFLKLIKLYCPNTIKKVIGFDFFGEEFTSGLNSDDKNPMDNVLLRVVKEDRSVGYIINTLQKSGFNNSGDYKLVQGNVSVTSKNFVNDNPGFRISLLYLDLDIDEPTYEALNNFWDRISIGGIIIFDEYGYHIWSESNAVDRFVREKGLKLIQLDCKSPTAYIIKTL